MKKQISFDTDAGDNKVKTEVKFEKNAIIKAIDF